MGREIVLFLQISILESGGFYDYSHSSEGKGSGEVKEDRVFSSDYIRRREHVAHSLGKARPVHGFLACDNVTPTTSTY